MRSESSSSDSSFSSSHYLVALALEPGDVVGVAALGFGGEALGVLPRLGQELLGLGPGAVHQDGRLLLGLAHGHVGGALREHECAADAVVVLLGRSVGDRPLRALGPVGELAHLLLQLLDRDRDLLEELVDLVGVVAAEAVTKLNLSQDFGRKIHALDGIGRSRKWGGYRLDGPRGAASGSR